MPQTSRTAFQQKVVEALIESKAINLAAVGSTLSKFGTRAVLEGETLVTIINGNASWNCGWLGPELDIVQQVGRQRSQ